MRDTHENMIELINVSNEGGVYSSVIKHKIGGESLKIRFVIVQSDYPRLKTILQFRPFENTGVALYRYFFALSVRKDLINNELGYTDVRVEQLGNHKQFEFCLSRKYLANLLWFNSITNIREIEKMIEK